MASSVLVFGFDNDSTPFNIEKPKASPREMHKILAEHQVRAFARQQEMEARYRSVPSAQDNYDVTYYELDLRIDDVAEIIYGRVTMRARALVDGFYQPILDFQAPMDIDSVYQNGVHTDSWDHSSDLLTIDLASSVNTGEEFEVTVVYHGDPIEVVIDVFYFSRHEGTPVISTLSEPFFARTWWPCKDRPDDKADSVDIIVEARSDLFVSS
ncbi:MAG: M1 family metallopeptidase, partial [Planctomycetes bacterium]|nr:M1 family metallopeptidase [Planctomycetota bacterium]